MELMIWLELLALAIVVTMALLTHSPWPVLQKTLLAMEAFLASLLAVDSILIASISTLPAAIAGWVMLTCLSSLVCCVCLWQVHHGK